MDFGVAFAVFKRFNSIRIVKPMNNKLMTISESEIWKQNMNFNKITQVNKVNRSSLDRVNKAWNILLSIV